MEARCGNSHIVMVMGGNNRKWTVWHLPRHIRQLLLSGQMINVPPPSAWVLGDTWLDTPRLCLEAVFGQDMSKIYMSRQSCQTVKYHDRPYLTHLSDGELDQRFSDVIGLPITIDAESNKVGFKPVVPLSENKLFSIEIEKMSDVFEECRCRYDGNYFPPTRIGKRDTGFSPLPLDDQRSRVAKKLSRYLRNTGTKHTIVRFGEAEYMRRLYERGELRMVPATEYSAKCGDNARQDDERTMSLNPYRGERRVVECSNYWLFSVSECANNPELLTRLFHDFKADACVAITDAPRFFGNLIGECRLRIPGTNALVGPVRYLDPVLDDVTSPNLPMVKHFRFLYQREVRTICVPHEHTSKALEVKKMWVGPLSEYAQYFD